MCADNGRNIFFYHLGGKCMHALFLPLKRSDYSPRLQHYDFLQWKVCKCNSQRFPKAFSCWYSSINWKEGGLGCSPIKGIKVIIDSTARLGIVLWNSSRILEYHPFNHRLLFLRDWVSADKQKKKQPSSSYWLYVQERHWCYRPKHHSRQCRRGSHHLSISCFVLPSHKQHT